MARSLIPSWFGGSPERRPADPVLGLQRELNRLFEDAFKGFGLAPAWGGGETPCVDLCETDKEYRLEAELPGVSEDDVEITLSDDTLTIRGEKKSERSERQGGYHMMERSYGSFARSIRLPFAVSPDEVAASFHNGLLTVTIPKKAAQQTGHRIEINKTGAPLPGSAGERAGSGQTGTPPTTH